MAENWLSKLNGNPLEWMLESNPWTRYGTLTDLMGYPQDGSEAAAARMQVAEHPMVRKLIAEAADWMPRAAGKSI